MKYRIIKWRFVNVDFDFENAKKVLQYLFFASLSLATGFLYNNTGELNYNTLVLGAILPSLYVFNYIYYQLSRFVFKYFIPKITFIDEKNRYNVFNSHSLLIHIFLVFLLCNFFLPRVGVINSSPGVLSLTLVFSFLFSLHRCLRSVETSENKPLISILKYNSFGHAHIFAGTCIGLPFAMGILIQENNLTYIDYLHDAIVTYVVFMLSWIILYQSKYKSSHFLDNYRFILPCCLYPITPLLFFIFYNSSIVSFFVVFSLMLLLYLIPIINLIVPIKLEFFINEKLILLVILFAIPFSQLSNLNTLFSDFNFSLEVSSIPIVPVLLSTLAMLFATRKDDKDIQYIRIYCIMPYFVLLLSMSSLIFIANNFLSPVNAIKNNILTLSPYVFSILGLTAIIFILISLFICYPKFIQDVFHPKKQ